MTIAAAVCEPPASADNPPAAQTVYTPRDRVDAAQTLRILARGGDGPCFRSDAGGTWLTQRRSSGPATLRIEQRGPAVHAWAWGAGAAEAIEAVPALLGRGDDWSGLDVSSSPLLSTALRRNPGLRLSASGLLVEMLVPSVIEQKVTCVEAWRAWRRLVRKHGDAAPGPAPEGMAVAPDADGWRHIPSWEWHEAGVDPRRSETVVRSCRMGAALDALAAAPAEEAERRVQSLPGIGPWTAAEATLRSHGHPDAVSVGDFHLAATVGTALIGERVDDAGMLELLAPWAGQRQRVLRLIGASGITAPRRGPRLTIQDHRSH